MKIPLEALTLKRHLLRHHLDPDQLRSLAEDLERNGQLQPIAVKRTGENQWELIAGRRRCQAAKLLGWTEIEAHEITSPFASEIPALAENLKRSQLTLLEEADIVHHLHHNQNMSIRDICAQTGHGTSWVQDRLEVADWPQDVRDAIHAGWFRLAAGRFLAQITNPEYRQWLIHLAKVNGCTMNQAEAWYLDWSARQKMEATAGYDGTIPHPLPLPPLPSFVCYLCGGQKRGEDKFSVTICIDCAEEVNTLKTQPPPALASPASEQDGAGKKSP